MSFPARKAAGMEHHSFLQLFHSTRSIAAGVLWTVPEASRMPTALNCFLVEEPAKPIFAVEYRAIGTGPAGRS
eukprot:4818602-Heterocapsa_arctica.AAC.1